jgi:hypothetical protein
MKKSLQQKLFDKYPKLYAQRHLTIRESCMPWGICVGNGWYDLIDKLSQDITDIINKEGCKITCEAVQVKEKFGGLRFYVDFGNQDLIDVWTDFLSAKELAEKISELISLAESESFKICDICGEPGTPQNDGWISTRCEKHAKLTGAEIRLLEIEEDQ